MTAGNLELRDTMFEESVKENGGFCEVDDGVVVVMADESTRRTELDFLKPSGREDLDNNSQSSTVPSTKDTLPETPPQSEASSSDSSHDGIIKRTLQYSPQSIAYNPITCHSPHRRRRRHEIMGISILQLDKVRRYESDDDDDASLENSVAALESASIQIRSDLLNTEMLELAAEAERAAEAGAEHFAAQPCIFQDENVPELLSSKPSSIARRSFSEGTHGRSASSKTRRRFLRRSTSSREYLAQNTSSHTKLSVVDLRDVHEVFPSFRQFHTHLRTHFFRSNVNQDQLYFDENFANLPFEQREIATIKSDGDMALPLLQPTDFGKRRLPPLLSTFRLDKWMHESRPDVQGSVGEVVSNHISTRPPEMRRVEVPPGLLDENHAEDPTTQHQPMSDTPPSSVMKIYSNNKIPDSSSPSWGLGSLFQVDDLPIEEDNDPDEIRSPEFTHPPHPDSPPPSQRIDSTGDIVDFVTPQRLRKIRRPRRRKTFQRYLDGGMVLPVNSMAEDSPLKKAHSVNDQLTPVPSIFFPPASTSSKCNLLIEESTESLALSPIEALPASRLSPRRSISPSNLFRHRATDSLTQLGYSDNSLLESRLVSTADAVESDCGCLSLSPPGSVGECDDDSIDRNVGRQARQPRSERSRQNRQQRALYARSKENDDFMSNYLYCSSSKPLVETREEVDKEVWERCADSNLACGEGNTGFCCASLFNEAISVDAIFQGHARTTSTPRSWIQLGSKNSSTHSESWFDMANDRLDAALVNIMGGGADRVRASFRAPTLRKKLHDEGFGLPGKESDGVQQDYRYDIDEESVAVSTSLLLEAQVAA